MLLAETVIGSNAAIDTSGGTVNLWSIVEFDRSSFHG
jgi:hypothetical protein